MKKLSGFILLASAMMLWNGGTAFPASAASPRNDRQAARAATASHTLDEFSSRHRHHRRFGHVHHYRRSFALYRPYVYPAYHRPTYRAFYRPYYRTYRAFSFYRPWYRPYYGGYYRPAYSYYRPVGYGWPYYPSYYGPQAVVSIGPFGFRLF
jgi:hypothetical protein